MYKSIVLHERRPEFTRQRFMDHWLNVHAPMSEGVQDLHGYVCSEIIDDIEPSGVPRFAIAAQVDGIAQMWFEHPDGLVHLPRQPRVKEWFSDGPNFIGRRMRFMAVEHVLAAPQRLRGTTPKLVFFLVRRENTDQSRFRSNIEALFHPRDTSMLSRLGLSIAHIVSSPTSPNIPGFPMPAIDSVLEVWLPNKELATDAVSEVVGALAHAHSRVPLSGARIFLTSETVIHSPPIVTRTDTHAL